MLEERAKNKRGEQFLDYMQNPTYLPSTYLTTPPKRHWYSSIKDHIIETIYTNFPGLEPKRKITPVTLDRNDSANVNSHSVVNPISINLAPNTVQVNVKENEIDYDFITNLLSLRLTAALKQQYENRP